LQLQEDVMAQQLLKAKRQKNRTLYMTSILHFYFNNDAQFKFHNALMFNYRENVEV